MKSSRPSRSARLRATVDTLARKLSKQNLQLTGSSRAQLPTAPPSPSPADAPRTSADLANPSLHPGLPAGHTPECLPPASPYDLYLGPDLPIEADEDAILGARFAELYPQPSSDSDYRRYLPGSMSDVRLEPALAPTPPFHTTTAPPTGPKADPDVHITDMDLEVDETYGTAADMSLEDDAALIEAFRARRRAAIPGGMVRRTVGGVPLHYRLSADAALRCQNVVRSKPRMRKRKRTTSGRPESIASSSAMTDSVSSSPVIPPSIPSPSMDSLP